MPTTTILRIFYFFATVPVYLVGRIFLSLDVLSIRCKLERCIKVVDRKHAEIPSFYVSYLVSAEDHRSSFHFGIDQAGIARAILKTLICSEMQGASTIEQQFVRVVTGDYRYTLKRKCIEQLLAVLISKERSKTEISRAYLAIAYYGHKCEGASGISNLIGSGLKMVSEDQIISVMARLKYPEPSTFNEEWEKRLSQRVSYIKNRHI